ncbi:B12-binding domain-containing radical SAM protein, partial [Candidatus Margulisiibacteriota bacterium]
MQTIKNLDCLLISPPLHDKNNNIWKQIGSNFPPLGLASLAGYLRNKNYTVKIIDSNIETPSVAAFRAYFTQEYVQKYASIRVIGLTSMTCNIKKAYKIAEICKEYYPNALVVFGGVHATFLTAEVINNKFVDVVVQGEGEITFYEIVAGADLKKIKGIVFKFTRGDKYQVKTNQPRERIEDLDSLPPPAYDLLPILKYKPTKGSYKKLPAMSMITSRGCPGKCTYCSKPLGDQVVFKSAKTIFKEIVYLVRHYNI